MKSASASEISGLRGAGPSGGSSNSDSRTPGRRMSGTRDSRRASVHRRRFRRFLSSEGRHEQTVRRGTCPAGTLGCVVDDVRVTRPAREPPTARPIGIPVPSAPMSLRARPGRAANLPRKPMPALDGGDTMVPRSVKKTAILMTLVTCSLGVGVSSATAGQPAGRCPSVGFWPPKPECA